MNYMRQPTPTSAGQRINDLILSRPRTRLSTAGTSATTDAEVARLPRVHLEPSHPERSEKRGTASRLCCATRARLRNLSRWINRRHDGRRDRACDQLLDDF